MQDYTTWDTHTQTDRHTHTHTQYARLHYMRHKHTDTTTHTPTHTTPTTKHTHTHTHTPTTLRMARQDFEWWSLLPLSLPARIHSVKMNTLPKFSYLFQSIPIFLPQTFFRKIESLVTECIWNRKPPRIRKSFLQRPKKLGGMALPNFQYYFWAANIRALHYWLHSDIFSRPTHLVGCRWKPCCVNPHL